MSMHKIVDGVRVDLTAEEIAEFEARQAEWEASAPDRLANNIREQRNELLAETDWWVLPDRTATQEQLDYRQALRDITTQEGFPETVVFPTKP